ncbi:uncharacterized protein B0H18DRAFT_968423, partial [Fomitopsis serialis]|uniref:uncharacterized protein n=1 Tax=Fomitopsis serialis TaxID=139415 RepID=UPI002007890E
DGRARYRCIAAYHHQWCYGHLSLAGVGRFITLLRQKENAEVVQAEIESIQGKYGRGPSSPSFPNTHVPWCVDKGEEDSEGRPYISGLAFTWSALPADSGFGTAGISIIDVTKPESPAYCFIRSERRCRPIDAQEYMSAYGHAPTDERKLERALQILADIPLVTQDMLNEAWPEQDRNETADTNPADVEVVATTADADEPQMSLVPALDQAISTGDTSMIERLLSQLDKDHQIQAFPKQRSLLARSLLLNDVQAEAVDLSGFHLSTDQLLQILSSCKEPVCSLNLSFNECITSETVAQLLTTSPSLRRLVLIGCTSIKEADLFDLLRNESKLFYKLDTLLHPSLLEISEPPRWPVAFTFASTSHATTAPRIRGCCLPVFTPTSIVQSLLDFAEVIAQSPAAFFASDGGMVAQAAFTATRKPGQPFSERSLAAAPLFGLKALAKGSHPSWVCMYQWGQLETPTGCQYTFNRYRNIENIDEEDGGGTDEDRRRPSVERFDLQGFLAALESEGRPSFLLSKEESERRTSEASRARPTSFIPTLPASEADLQQMYREMQQREQEIQQMELQRIRNRDNKTAMFMPGYYIRQFMQTVATHDAEYRLFGYWGDSEK